MQRSLRVLGILIICISVIAFIGWEKYGRSRFLTDEILMFSQNVEKGTIIREDMITVIRVENASSEVLRSKDIENIVGQESVQFIHKDAPLFWEYFSEPEMSTGGEDQRMILTMAESWIASMPEGIKRGDRIGIWSGEEFLMDISVYTPPSETENLQVLVTRNQMEKLGAQNLGTRKLVLTKM